MTPPPVAPSLRGVLAAVFDTDGVITDSARVHAAAWKEAFDPLLREHAELSGTPFRPFDAVEEYRRHVDGKSRLDGAAALLAARGLRASPEDVREVAARKEAAFTAALRGQGARPFPGTVRLLRALDGAGVPCAAVSASRHARELLESAGVLGLLKFVVDGGDAARLGLPGKPDPALFVEAARRLGAPADRTALFEDALAGVAAGRRGGFAPVIGVDRTAGPDSADDLRAHGADLVVRDPADLLPGGPAAGEEAER